MKRMTWFSFLVSGFALCPLVNAESARKPGCKSVPSSSSWPDSATWASFNKTLKGKLLSALPPAIVCDPDRKSLYNKKAYAAVGENWGDVLFHAEDPISVQSPNFQADGCLPTAIYHESTSCFTKPFAHYVVKATKAAHIAEAVKFASKHNVRLSVKATGHDYLGRSAQPGLPIWTRHMRGICILKSFKPKACKQCEAKSAIKISAGNTFGDVYQVAREHNVIPVVGAQSTVGLGGYLLGNGHSPISTKYELAVDSTLEMEAVTPDGKIVTANDYTNPDLFWAMKGGGGSTFGVITSATLKTYPTFPVTTFSIQFTSTKTEAKKNNNDNYYDLLGDFHTTIPSLSDANVTGGSFFAPLNAQTSQPITDPEPLIHGPQLFFFSGTALNSNEEEIRKLLRPFNNKLERTKGIQGKITVSPQIGIYKTIQSTQRAGSDQITGKYVRGKLSAVFLGRQLSTAPETQA